MTCPLCGKATPCAHTRRSTAALADQDAHNDVYVADDQAPAPSAATLRAVAGEQRSAADPAWRREIVSRVQQHRARRRRVADPNALELDFSADTPYSFGAEQQDGAMAPPPERFHEIVIPQNMVKPVMGRPEPPKVIRFPRTQPAYVPTVEEVMLDELEQAAPAPEAPRIMEVYDTAAVEPTPPKVTPSLAGEQMELLPSFSDIRLEPEDARYDDDPEIIPRPAPLGQRCISGVVDAGLVFIAIGAFAITFLELAEEMPQSRMTLVCLLAAAGIFWLLFQYIFLTYRRATPGMRMAQLELCTFEGKETTMFDRQTRAAASALSAFSVGLGYFWALVDEDRLGWHDRISQTHLRAALSSQPSASSPEIFDYRMPSGSKTID
ncbi:MAG TPA: RDD family protein [Candidatus Angelobacter sp.]|nr:RDD family protein [Candidatus Angelobacter sp.]